MVSTKVRHVVYKVLIYFERDDEESTPEDLSPWEIVPAGQDFNAMYNVGPELSNQDKQRAREILDWLMNNEEFQLYVEPVDYYSYRQYLSLIAYPICLQTVSERLEGNFYRSRQVNDLNHDVYSVLLISK